MAKEPRWLPRLVLEAAAYGVGVTMNHPFRDGNKRAGFLAMVVFAGLNGRDLRATDAEVVTVMFGLAAGQITEAQLAAWLRPRLKRVR